VLHLTQFKSIGFGAYAHIASQTVPSLNFVDSYCCRRTRCTVDSYSNFFHTTEHKLSAYPRESCRCFFALARYRMVQITCSYSEVVLWTIKNYKAHYNLSWFRPLLWGNIPTSSIFVLEKKNSVTKEVSWELEMFTKCNGEKFLPSPCLKGREPFIPRRRLDNYQLLSIMNISTKLLS
jgi:hypothetical protein